MRDLLHPIRPVTGVTIAALLLIGCSSPTASPSASSTSSAAASPTASGVSSTESATGSPSATASPTVLPTPVPTPVLRPTPKPITTTKPTATPLPPTGGPAKLALESFASGLHAPDGIVNAGDGSGRLFVVQQSGQIRVVGPDGSLRAAPFVDLAARIVAGGEQGLLGLAFHPNFAANGRLFVDYTRAADGAEVVSELTASADRGSANPASERVLLVVPDPYVNHNGGQLAFGPDGYLYIAMGDGGGGGDPLGNAQSRKTLLGKILRVDVNAAHASGKQYAIPNSNPYAPGGTSPGAGLPEIWAYGLRNPWRFSFDRGTGDMYIGDVGQSAWEEIDRLPAGSAGGQNFGWNAFEGTHCYSAACSGLVAVPPIAEYSHAAGCSVTGGYVYRGTRQPAMKGIYIFGDYCSGTIFTVPAGGGTHPPKPVAATGRQISSFGEGENGEVYMVDLVGGGLYRVVVGS